MASTLETIAQWPGQAWSALTGMGRRLGRSMAASVGQNLKPVWPPEAHAHRLREYEQMEELYEGDQRKYFEAHGWTLPSKKHPYVCVNLLGGLVDLLATRSYGEGFEVEAPTDETATQAFLEDTLKRNALQRVVYDQCQDGLPKGDKAYKVVYSADLKQIAVQPLDPEIVFPEFDLLDETKLIAANIDQVLDLGLKRVYLWRERHELRGAESWVLNQLFRLDVAGEGDGREYRFDPIDDEVPLETLDATAALPPEAATGIEALLVVWQGGESVFTDPLLSIQGEYNDRVTQKSTLFRKHLPATILGPPLWTDAVGEDGEVDLEQTRYIPIDNADGTSVVLVEWTAAGFTAVDEHLKQLLTGFAFSAGVDVSTLLPDQAQAASSGTALKRQQMKTQGTVNRLQVRDEPTIAEVLSVCTKLGAVLPIEGADIPTPLAVHDLTFTWQDGLPADRVEDVAEHVQLVTAGIESKHDANKALFGGSDDDVTKRMAELSKETAAGRPASPTVRVTSPFAAIQPVAPGG